MNISEELKELDDLMASLRFEMNNLKFYSQFIKKSAKGPHDGKIREETMLKVSRILQGMSDVLSSKSMDINVQIENKDYSERYR